MNVIEPGHIYSLDKYDSTDNKKEILTFFKRVGEYYPGNEPPPHTGTNCQEVLRVLIDRIKYLNNQQYCPENDDILEHLRESLHIFEFRANALHDYDPSNIDTKIIETYLTCKICGHIECEHQVSL